MDPPYPPQSHSQYESPQTQNHNVLQPQAQRIRRRNRMITSCLECRRRKLKCDKSHPCANCVRGIRDCVFLDQASQLKLTEIKEKVGSLERLLERDARSTFRVTGSGLGGGDEGTSVGGKGGQWEDDRENDRENDREDDLPALDDERHLEPTPLAIEDAAYGDDGEDDDLLDLGIQMGKMRITERIGGLFRPKIAQELDVALTNISAGSISTAVSSPQSQVQPLESPLPSTNEWLGPGPGYIAPSAGFFFGQGSDQRSLVDYLPSRYAADLLIKQYFAAVYPIARIVHRPTFEKLYEGFWDDVSVGIEPPNSVQTIIFAAMFSGVVSMDESTVVREFGVTKASLVDNFKLGTEMALGRANFLWTTKIETLQAFVMYLIPLCRAEISRAHSVLLGAAIRMGECMGLHRDGETYGMNPLETHIRRLIWYQLCFLDIRTCEAQGPRPTIHRENFDTKFPLNVDDADLHPYGLAPVPADRWTDMTFTLMRFEANEMMRTIWVDRPRIERQKISLTAVLTKIETFKKSQAAKYDHMLDEHLPIQKYAKTVKALLMGRFHTMVLHRYHNSVVSPMPERLRTLMVANGMTAMEAGISCEMLPEFKPWAWYNGAYHQFHIAFLLLMEIYVHPERKEADRIWVCLDYVYETNPLGTREQKARTILGELRRKTAVYQSMRGMRAPAVMNQVNMRELESTLQKHKDKHHEMSLVKTLTLDQTVPLLGPDAAQTPMQYADVNDGQSLWVLQTHQLFPCHQPLLTNSDTPSQTHPTSPQQTTSGDDLMADIDWEAFDALFPPQYEEMLFRPEYEYPFPLQGYQGHGVFPGGQASGF
ncbi:hypothetical protein BJ878DRAFT_274233 [Calycina marina]|uniref:Zn(2)-C6 fungal-type domain-containing protein n=1 Tax=Calycina marina TaxID=1763456 RepID=A0A9P8CH61_9HELO|nr:hypothetical protein BJ878DRAFT_274233 [Calycina marina]